MVGKIILFRLIFFSFVYVHYDTWIYIQNWYRNIYIYIYMYIYKLKNPHLNVKWSEYTNKKNEFERTKTLL